MHSSIRRLRMACRTTSTLESPEHFNVWSGDQRAPLSERSLAYLYRFIKWQEGEGDPVATLEFTDEEVEQMRTHGPTGLGQLLTKARALGSTAK